MMAANSDQVSKNLVLRKKYRAAGEHEGVRPASCFNNPPLKSLIYQGFQAKRRFEEFQNGRRLKRSKKSYIDFFDKLKLPHLSR